MVDCLYFIFDEDLSFANVAFDFRLVLLPSTIITDLRFFDGPGSVGIGIGGGDGNDDGKSNTIP